MSDSKPCFRCKTAPRAGRASYCKPCIAQYDKVRKANLGVMASDGKPCARCGVAPRPVLGRPYCRPCSRERARERKEQRLPCGRCGVNRSIQKSHYCYRCSRDVWLRRAYGISVDEYDAMVAVQSGKCASCGCAPPTSFDRNPETGYRLGPQTTLDVDHDHATGRVRGLLCNRCNRGIGVFADSPERLRLAAAYLERTA